MASVSTEPGGIGLRIGVDITAVQVVAARLRAQPGLAESVFTTRESTYARNRGSRRDEHLAARFAAKEAVFKALGQAMPWHDVEVINAASGRPRLRLRGAAEESARALGVESTQISISHSGGYAVAFVVLATGAHRAEAAIGLLEEAAP